MLSAAVVIGALRIKNQRLEAKKEDPDEVAHNGMPNLDLRCLQNQLLSFLGFNPFLPGNR